MFQLKCLAIIRPNYTNTKVGIGTPFCILVIRPDDGYSFLAETYSLILSEYNVVLTDCNIHF